MRPRPRRLLVGSLLCAVGLTASCSTPAPPEVPDGLVGVVDALRDGGHVIFLRHAATDSAIPAGGDDPDADCGSQRNLTDAGREDATALGAALRALEVPIGEVVASPLCRTEETARLAFGTVRTDARLLPTGPRPQEALADLLTVPDRGNRVLVGHASTMADLLDVHLDEGEAAVLAVDSAGRPRLKGRLSADALGATSGGG